MAIVDLYSKRKRAAERAEKPDVYRYDEIPITLRRQIVYIIGDLFSQLLDSDDVWGHANDWTPKKDTAAGLVAALFDNGLLPSELQTHFAGVRTTLESGVATIRNQPGRAHGQGAQAGPPPPDHLTAYALHLTAAAIVFIVEAQRATAGGG